MQVAPKLLCVLTWYPWALFARFQRARSARPQKSDLSNFAFRLAAKEHGPKKATSDVLQVAKIRCRVHLSCYVYGRSTPGRFLPDFSWRAVSFRILPYGYRPKNMVPKKQLQISCTWQK